MFDISGDIQQGSRWGVSLNGSLVTSVTISDKFILAEMKVGNHHHCALIGNLIH